MTAYLLLKVYLGNQEPPNKNKLEIEHQVFYKVLLDDEKYNPVLLEYFNSVHEGFGRYSTIKHQWMFEMKTKVGSSVWYKPVLVSPILVDMLHLWGWQRLENHSPSLFNSSDW